MKLALLNDIIKQSNYKILAVTIFIVYFILYLFLTLFLVFSLDSSNPIFSLDLASNWQSLIFKQRAPFLYESIGTLYITPYIKFFISVPNIIIAVVLSIFVSLNVTVSVYMFRMLGLKGAKGMFSLVGTIPAIIGGAACCVPTLILVLGLQFTASLTTIWPWLVPFSFILLVISLMWVLNQVSTRVGITSRSTHEDSGSTP